MLWWGESGRERWREGYAEGSENEYRTVEMNSVHSARKGNTRIMRDMEKGRVNV